MAEELSVHEVFGGQDYLCKLLEELDTAFPLSLPQPSQSLPDIMFEAGQRSVVEYLYSKKEDVLKSPTNA